MSDKNPRKEKERLTFDSMAWDREADKYDYLSQKVICKKTAQRLRKEADEIEPKYGSGESCFIATAVYGDVEAPQVKTLRKFRDEKLSKSKLGRAAINFYYSGFGKKTAKYIQENFPSSIPVIRKGLDYLVKKNGNAQN